MARRTKKPGAELAQQIIAQYCKRYNKVYRISPIKYTGFRHKVYKFSP